MNLVLLLTTALQVGASAQSIVNLDQAKQAIRKYHASGKWERDDFRVVHRAERWIARRGAHGKHLALVLDIDETALLNWPEELATDFGYVPSLWERWEHEGKAPASPAVLELFRYAKKHAITVFFVTGRKESSRSGTVHNLNTVGFQGYRSLIMKPLNYHSGSVIPFKPSARIMIEREGYRIIENVGDQWSDLRGGHSERIFKLPNPVYFIP